MGKFLVVVECALEHAGKFLIIRRPPGIHAEGCLAFPGGKVEYQDGSEHLGILENAVKREIFEEVGLILENPIRFVMSSYFIDRDGVHVLDNIFHCKIIQSNIEVNTSPREVSEYFWFTKDEILSHQDSPPWLKKYISAIETSIESTC